MAGDEGEILAGCTHLQHLVINISLWNSKSVKFNAKDVYRSYVISSGPDIFSYKSL